MELVMNERISQTGIRTGEYITASESGSQCKGVIIQVKGIYPVFADYVETTIVRDSYNLIPFFKNMSIKDRLEWIEKNKTCCDDLYMEDVKDLKVRFISICGDNYLTRSLSQEVLELLLSGNYWDIQDVYKMFPRKPNSKARKHTLIFRPSNWSLGLLKTKTDDVLYTGLYIDLNTGFVYNRDVVGDIRLFKNFAIKVEKGTDPIEIPESRVNSLIKWFPNSLHKSLIQKIIRTRCKEVDFFGERFGASEVLISSFYTLLTNPGSFVPNIQRFVTGLESATKRLAVSICEDSFTKDTNALLSLFSAALIAQTDKEWKPSLGLIFKWVKLAIECQIDPKMFDYSVLDRPNEVVDETSILGLSYRILSDIKSFQSDVNMLKSIALNQGRPRQELSCLYDVLIMPIIHCVDHHSYTEIAHFMEYIPNYSYSQLFRDVWNKVVGFNPRFKNNNRFNFETDNIQFVNEVRTAQRRVWDNKTCKPQNRPVLQKFKKLSYKLDDDWLAGLIGPIEIKVGSSTAIIVLQTDNIYEMVSVKRPSRDKSNPELTEDERVLSIKKAKSFLERGYKLKNIPQTLDILKDSVVYLREESYFTVLKSGQEVDWEEFKNLTYRFPVHSHLKTTIDNAIHFTGDGIDEKAALHKVLKNISILGLQRLMVYISGFRENIILNKVSRDGTGVDYSVAPEDTLVNEILCRMCVLYPAAIVKTLLGFKVKCGPLFWMLRDKICKYLDTHSVLNNKWEVPVPDNRKLFEHQKDSLERMINKKRGHLLWISVGAGKTLIIICYIKHLIETGKMPLYCVYTLPPSAIDSIITELNAYKLKYVLLDMRMSAKNGNRELVPGVINIVKHDHLRMNGLDISLRQHAQNMLFIVDEFHKTLNKSIRTSLALEVSKLSKDFIGLSGTIIKDENCDDLIQWLEQIVNFEVTEKNYWVAIGSMISRKVVTNVVVNHKNIEVEIKDKEYAKCVPIKLGGTENSTINFKQALSICYNTCLESMIIQTKKYVNKGEGVLLVAKDNQQQLLMRDMLKEYKVHLITKDTPITLTHDTNTDIQIIITTIRQSEGYTISKFRILITCVYFSSQFTREQIVGRLNRMGQTSPWIKVITFHSGILSYVLKKYETARTLSEALKAFAKDIDLKDIKMLGF